MMQVVIQKSDRADKKLDAVIDGKKTIPFGQKNASDYTIHKNPQVKSNYIARHKPREDWTDPRTAGFYSRFVLWNKPTLKQSVDDLNKKYKNINFSLKQ